MEIENSFEMSRRSFVKSLAYALGGALVLGSKLSWAMDKVTVYSAETFLHLKGLGHAEWVALAAASDTIFPPMDGTPSGTDVGLLSFLSTGFGDKLPMWKRLVKGVNPNRGFSHFVPYYKKLLVRLDTASRVAHQKSFAELGPEERTAVMSGFADKTRVAVGYRVQGAPALKDATDLDLFDMLKRHAIEGYFAEPVHGGNKDYKGWESIRHVCNMNYPKEASCPTKVI